MVYYSAMNNAHRLLDTALRLFSLRGYDAVGVREIVEEAGVTKPTLYHYFASKRGLLDALLQREAGHLISRVKSAAVYQGDLVFTLESIARAYFAIAQETSTFYRLHLTMFFSPPESESSQAIGSFTQEQLEILTGVFDQAIRDHGNLAGRQKRYAVGFLGVINAMIGLYLQKELALTDELVYQAVHQFMYGIFS